jgi:hypothetical protein
MESVVLLFLREGKLPHIRISEVKVHGPIEEKQGGLEEVAVFGKTASRSGQGA